MICLDTDILAIHHIFRWDERYDVNEQVLSLVKKSGKACTTIHNVLELCGLYAVARRLSEVEQVLETYLRSSDIKVLFPEIPRDWGDFVASVMQYVKKGIPYGDSLIAMTIEQHPIEVFLTWNVKHFRNKIGVLVLNPDEFLKKSSETF